MQGQARLTARGKGVYGAVVEVVAAASPKWLKHRQLTGPDGSFHLDASAWFTVRVLDQAGLQLLTVQKLEWQSPRQILTVELGAASDNARLPRQPSSKALLSGQVFKVLHSAAAKAERARPRSGGLASLASFLRGLPPLATYAGLLDAAHGVMRGSSAALQRYAHMLADLEQWSKRQGFVPRPDRAAIAATYDEKVWSGVSQRLAKAKTGLPRIFEVSCMGVLAAAAIRLDVDAGSARRRLAVLDHHVAALSELGRLYQLADAVLEGSLSEAAYLDSLRLHGGQLDSFDLGALTPSSFGGFDWPTGGDDPGDGLGGFIDFDPSDFPEFFGGIGGGRFGPGGRPSAEDIRVITPRGGGGGGGAPFPLLPETPHDAVPGLGDVPERIDMWGCVVEIVRNLAQISDRSTRYEILGVEPARACEGQELIIRGENLRFEDRDGTVLFVRADGSAIEVVPIESTSTQIRVVVPPGAGCTDLELHVPGSIFFSPHCPDVELFFGPEVAFHFDGGATTIRRFAISSALYGCFRPGEAIEFNFRSCNADTARLTLTAPDGQVLLTRDLGGSGSVSVAAPRLPRNTVVTATLEVFGPCGSDTRTLTFTVDAAFVPSLAIPFVLTDFPNWHRDEGLAASLLTATPRTLAELVRAIQTAELLGSRLGVSGSNWSYSDCVLPTSTSPRHRLISTDSLNADGVPTDLDAALSSAEVARLYEDVTVLPSAAESEVRSVLDAATLNLFSGDGSTVDPNVAPRLVHVRASIKLSHLNWLLDGRGLAMATLGGSNGQTLAGAIGTATHGTNPGLPPIQDFIHAVHLVGPGGVQWWIEPSSRRVTRPEAMEELKANGTLDPCLRVEYDDELFNASLVSLGGAGVMFAVVLEAVPAHALESVTRLVNWADAGALIESEALSDAPPFFFELVMNTSDSGRLTIRRPLPASSAPVAGEAAQLLSDILTGGLVGSVATAVFPSVVTYLTQRAAQIVQAVGDPLSALIRLPQVIAEFERDSRLIQGLVAGLEASTRLLTSGGSESDLATAAVTLLNFLWDLGLFVVPGRTVIQTIQNQVTDRERPLGTTVNKSFTIYNSQTTAAPMKHGAFERLVESYEFIVEAERCFALAVAIRDLAREIQDSHPFIVTINLRFTEGTRATVGMQRFARSGYVEVWTFKGMRGNAVFHPRLEALAGEFSAIPHWGHYHRRHEAVDYAALFGSALTRWTAQLNRIARASATPNTFRRAFFGARGLLPDL